MVDPIIATLQNTVQIKPDAREHNTPLFWYMGGRGDILPAWGTRLREQKLIEWDRYERNWMWQGARTGLAKKVASAPNELSGGRNTTSHFRQVLDDAHFGAGWQVFIKRVIRDYLRHDVGAFVEIIAPGDPMKPPTGRVIGIAHLDTMRCYPTGDPIYPVVYMDMLGKYHLMHNTRVIQFVDMPDGDDMNPGYGESALSRAITIAQRDVNMTKYVDAQLDDKPAPGIMIVKGMSSELLKKAVDEYRRQQSRDNGSLWGNQLVLPNPSSTENLGVEHQSFSQAPAAWSFKEYVELDANALALALGTDVQEIWQLTGGNMGSGQQSQILHAKSQGKAFGDLLTMIERAINFRILPEALTFEFKRHDPYESKESADTAQVWANVASQTSSIMSADEQRVMLANQVEAIKDAITDADGQVVRLIDSDPETPEQEQDSIESVEDADGTPDNEPESTADDSGASTEEPDSTADDMEGDKAIQATRIDFEDGLADLLAAAREGGMNRRMFSIRLRNLLAVNGRKAYTDGLTDGGVNGEMSDDDTARVNVLIADQSQYVTELGARLFNGDGVTDAQAGLKPELWFNKSIQPFYDAGLLSAAQNGMFEWVLGKTEQHCKTCLGLSGQRHRLKLYHQYNLIPKSSKLECGGWLCDCRLQRTKETARGRLTAFKHEHTHDHVRIAA